MSRIIVQVILIFAVLIILYLIVFPKSSIRESLDLSAIAPGGGGPKPFYGKPGIPAIPLDIPIPKTPMRDRGDGTFIDYANTDLNKICPSKPGTSCRTVLDCGPAELCVDQAGWIVDGRQDMVQPESAVCVCSIQNACVSGGNIC